MISLKMIVISVLILLVTPLHSNEIRTSPHLWQKQRRHRALATSKHSQPHSIAPIWGAYDTHFVDLWIGHPEPQRVTTVIDTTSQITAFPCIGCSNCGIGNHMDYYFNYGHTSTFAAKSCEECWMGECDGLKCHMNHTYRKESHWDAFEASDRCYAGGFHFLAVTEEAQEAMTDDATKVRDYAFDLSFACQNTLTGPLAESLQDGVLGMGDGGTSYWKQMYERGAVEKQLFSLCYNFRPRVDGWSSLAGVMSLGGVDERLWKTPVVYASRVDETGHGGYYGVTIRALYLWEADKASLTGITGITTNKQNIAKVAIHNKSITSIIDSATSETRLSATMKKAFNKAWFNMVGTQYSNFQNSFTHEDIITFPTIIIQLQGDNSQLPRHTVGLAQPLDSHHPNDILIAIPPSNYFQLDESTNKYMTRLSFSDDDTTILGSNVMVGHDVVFDIDNGRIGWAESDCDYDKILNPSNETDAYHAQEYTAIEDDSIVTSLAEEITDDVNDHNDISLAKTKDAEVSVATPSNVYASHGKDVVNDGAACTSVNCRIFVFVVGLVVSALAVLAWMMSRSGASRSGMQLVPQFDEDDLDDDTEMVALNMSVI